jgi:hypothetical protein
MRGAGAEQRSFDEQAGPVGHFRSD